ncbi:hypothetical protein [Faecalicoccus pleomorphus]|uniref:hypothetical protein n=1 Tax=Faecalicoccus pleomorphus TaxID=1323 RepID=UPI002942BD06|nr:hypothetical protein [Faecalicoccus pleomorphus]
MEKSYLDETPQEEVYPDYHHTLKIAKPGRDYVECAICGRKGYICMEESNIRYTWP